MRSWRSTWASFRPRVLEEEPAAGQITHREQVEEHDDQAAHHHPEVLHEDDVPVGREELQLAEDRETQQEQDHGREERGIDDH
ncbi:MAG: hypothetical protein ABI868_05815 [Acidobacteriota bacterium]